MLFALQALMTTENFTHFALADGTLVTVSSKHKNKYDFELKLLNGNRKTFLWYTGLQSIQNAKGVIDELANEAIIAFRANFDKV